jgi:hypothetical protein
MCTVQQGSSYYSFASAKIESCHMATRRAVALISRGADKQLDKVITEAWIAMHA